MSTQDYKNATARLKTETAFLRVCRLIINSTQSDIYRKQTLLTEAIDSYPNFGQYIGGYKFIKR